MNSFCKAFFWVAWCFLAIIAATYIVGCSVSHPTPGSGITHPTLHAPQTLNAVSVWLDIFMIVAIPAAVAGVVLFFLAPEAHRLSLFLATGGGALFGVSALLKVSLWLVPWIAAGLGVLALLALAYELYVKLRKNTDIPALIKSVL